MGIVEQPLNNGAQIESKGKPERMFLSKAARGAISSRNIESQYSEGRTPLSLACIRGDCEGTALLLDNGADIESVGSEGKTPLLLVAAMTPCLESVIETLLDKGATSRREIIRIRQS